jgi:Rhs element Vgr protein
MAIQSQVTIRIKGEAIHAIKRMFIHQDMDSHHLVEFECRTDTVDDASQSLAATSKSYIGELVEISISTKTPLDNYGSLEFKGVITKVSTKSASQNGSGENTLHFKAESCSKLADDGMHNGSFNESTLQDIINNTFRPYDTAKLEVQCNPVFASPLLYTVQQEESAYQFAYRLASQYGEWFYYNGSSLVFGSANSTDVTLTYGIDLKEFALELNPTPNAFNYFTNDFLQETQHQKASNEVSTVNSGFNGFTATKSDALYPNKTEVFVNTHHATDQRQRFDALVALDKKANHAKEVLVKCVTDNPGVVLGGVVTLKGAADGNYRVIKIRHEIAPNGDYQNRFEAINAEAISPNTSINAFPKSDTQIAKVTDNVDPDGLSRIKVQFPWQARYNQSTPWIRVLTPHSGADKGFHFIPEIGEEVMVGFEGGNAERPYVMGALYTGVNKADSWQTDANNVKAIRTRSGHTIELNDTQGEEKIRIYDNEASIIEFDTQAKSLTINATENLVLGAKNIQIIAQENIDIQAKGNITKAAEGDVAVLSQGSMNLQATGNAALSSNAAVAIEAASDATINATNAVVKANASAEISGMEAKLNGSTMTEVAGSVVKIN